MSPVKMTNIELKQEYRDEESPPVSEQTKRDSWSSISDRWHNAAVNDNTSTSSNLKRSCLYIAVLLAITLLTWTARGQYDDLPSTTTNTTIAAPPHYGFVTFLNAYYPSPSSPTEDIFFTNTRMLTYQVLHAPTTRVHALNIDFIVAVTPDVEQWKRDRLVADGAVVREVSKIAALEGGMFARWQDMMCKLELFTFTDYDKLVYIDADTVLRESLEGIFSDQGAQLAETRRVNNSRIEAEASMPEEYLFASIDDLTGHGFGGPTHKLARRGGAPKRWRYFSGGFWMFRPDLSLHKYLTSLIPLSDGRFDPVFQEQNLLNYAFRREGPMPWTELNWQWNLWAPNQRDWEMGIKSLHVHGWERNKLEEVRGLWVSVRGEMEGFWAGREGRVMPVLLDGLLVEEGKERFLGDEE